MLSSNIKNTIWYAITGSTSNLKIAAQLLVLYPICLNIHSPITVMQYSSYLFQQKQHKLDYFRQYPKASTT